MNGASPGSARALLSTRDSIVPQIVAMVQSGTFVSGKSHRQLEEEYGLGANAICKYVQEAFLLIRHSRPELVDEINHRLANIDHDRTLALARVRCYAHKGEVISREPDPDVNAALAADRLYLETIGALMRVRAREAMAGGEEPDLVGLLRVELSTNRPLLEQALRQFTKSELRDLIERARPDIIDVEPSDQ
jgi:hypothetical protein